jgi:hypothetical protein
MSLHYYQTVITPYEVGCLHDLITNSEPDPDQEAAYRWLCQLRSGLFDEWQSLPDGNHLKEAYRDEAWKWDDRDLSGAPDNRRITLEDICSPGGGLSA